MNLTELITQARTGDKSAINALYDAYKTPVYYLCQKLTQNQEAAGEMLQRSFLHAFHKLNLLRDPEDFPKWIMAVASNRCKNYLKEQNPDLFDGDLPEAEQRSKFCMPEFDTLSRTAADDEARAFLSGVIDRLPVTQRFALMMCFFGAMSEVQASRILECSEMATKNALQQATETLEKAAADKGDEIPALAEYKSSELNALLLRDAELARVPGFVAEEVAKNAPALIFNQQAAKERENADYRSGSRKGGLLVPVFILILGIAVVIAGFAVAGKIREGTNPPDTTTGSLTTPAGTTASDEPDTTGTTLPDDTAAPDPDMTTGTDTQTVPDTTQPVPDTTQPAETTPTPTDDPTPASSFTCKTVNGQVTITAYTGSDTRVVIPSSVDGKPVTMIGNKAFAGTKIQSVVIPDSVTVIGVQAFKDCTSLTEVSLPSSLTEIQAYAFRGCTKLAEISLPDSVKTVGPTCFGSTAWFDSQPAGFLTLGRGLLIKYNGTGGDVTVPAGTTYISNAFYYDGRTTSVTIADSVTALGQFAFCSCSKLTSITIPANVTSIDPQAIYNCKALQKILVKKGSYAETWCKSYGFGSLVEYY